MARNCFAFESNTIVIQLLSAVPPSQLQGRGFAMLDKRKLSLTRTDGRSRRSRLFSIRKRDEQEPRVFGKLDWLLWDQDAVRVANNHVAGHLRVLGKKQRVKSSNWSGIVSFPNSAPFHLGRDGIWEQEVN